jgi:hypothetical protein
MEANHTNGSDPLHKVQKAPLENPSGAIAEAKTEQLNEREYRPMGQGSQSRRWPLSDFQRFSADDAETPEVGFMEFYNYIVLTGGGY